MDRALEELVWERAGHRCEYCQMPQEYERTTLEIDHVTAISHGGPTHASNLCLACLSCNSFIRELVDDTARRNALGAAAREFVAGQQGATERTMALLDRLLVARRNAAQVA